MINPLHIINVLRMCGLCPEGVGCTTIAEETMNLGNRAVTLRCKILGVEGDRLLKCYHRPLRNGCAKYGDKYHIDALELYTIGGNLEYADVLVDDWVEGTPLDIAIRDSEVDIWALSRAFDRMALGMLEANWAHGDIKPENIICKADGSQQLIDLDAMWHEGLSVIDCDELGTPEFNHPRRPNMPLSKHIDDYAIALVSTILAATALDPEAFRGALDTRRNILLPRHIVEGDDEAYNYALGLLATHDKAHHAIALQLQTPDGCIDNLHTLISEALEANKE